MTSPSTVLIVDDLPAMSQLIATLLSGDEYRLEFAYCGAEALAKAELLRPDLMLLDVMMPDMDGFSVCRRLRATPQLAEIPIIIVTALDDRISRVSGLEAGADDFISKPFDPAELRARVRTVIRLNRYRRLLAERDRFQRLIELSPDGIFTMDPAGLVRLVNPAMLRILGSDDETEVLNQPAARFIAPEHVTGCQQAFSIEGNVQTPKRFTTWFVRCDGSQFPVEVNAGRLEWGGDPMVQAIVRDITERKRAEEMLYQRNQELAMLNRASQKFVASLDLHEVLTAVLDEIHALFGAVRVSVWLEDTMSGELICWRAAGPGSDDWQGRRVAADAGLVGHAFMNGETVLVPDTRLDARYHPQADASTGEAQYSVLATPFISQNRVFGVLQLTDAQPDRFGPADLALITALAGIAAVATENALLFRAVNMQRGQLRALAGRLSEIQELERHMLARELHDQIGQNLTVISLNMTAVDQQLPSETPSAVRQRVSDSIDLLGETTKRMRNVMADLHPPVLDDYGLLAALRWYGEQFTLRTGIPVAVVDNGVAVRCPATQETALFRVAQEALNNVTKHAQASQVEITLQCEDSQFRLAIADNGNGFIVADVKEPTDEPHWGLLTMEERVLAVGGTLQIISQPGAGTTVVAEVTL